MFIYIAFQQLTVDISPLSVIIRSGVLYDAVCYRKFYIPTSGVARISQRGIGGGLSL